MAPKLRYCFMQVRIFGLNPFAKLSIMCPHANFKVPQMTSLINFLITAIFRRKCRNWDDKAGARIFREIWNAIWRLRHMIHRVGGKNMLLGQKYGPGQGCVGEVCDFYNNK